MVVCSKIFAPRRNSGTLLQLCGFQGEEIGPTYTCNLVYNKFPQAINILGIVESVCAITKYSSEKSCRSRKAT